jgi:hypothetical protein
MRLRQTRAALAAAALVVSGLAAAAPATASQPDLDQVRRATAAFHSVAIAEEAGYADSGLPCFDASTGGMGFHWVRGPLDDAPQANSPDALVYEPGPDGQLRLVGVEYLMAFDASPNQAPELFGQTFHELDLPQFGLHVWELHAWIWRPNPAGTFTDFNAHVAPCPTS